MNIYEHITKFYEGRKEEKKILGKTEFGRTMYALKAGTGSPVGIAIYAIHGREYITAKLAIAQFLRGVERGSCWFVPLVNPDGALLSETGVSSAPAWAQEALTRLNGGGDFSLWKANGRGVDLNVNFPARWAKGVKNVRTAGSENFVGDRPCSEAETRALCAFTKEICPDYTVSYHTKGEEIYWRFHQSPQEEKRDLRLAECLSEATGYPLKEAKGSVGGYKDWCIERLKIPAFTIEVGKDEYAHPLGEDTLEEIVAKNVDAIYALSGRIECKN